MIGTIIGHYAITEKLAIGSLGEAWLARDISLNRSVALKILPASLAQEETTRKRFLQEARTAGSLEHPNIASVHEVGELADGRIWVAMSWSGGQSLREKEKSGPLSVEEAVGIAIQIGRGLEKAHEAGVVHRDVTPENVVVGEDGRVKIVDFAIAKLAGSERLTKTGMRTGTVAYMSPEQAAGKEVDARSDIWGLGVVLYEMISGSHPFEGEDGNEVITKVLRAEVKDTSGKVPWEVGRIIGRALEREAGDRYGSISEMVGELEWVQGKVSSGTLSKRTGVVVPRVTRKRRVVAGVLGAVAAVVVIGAGVGGALLWRAKSAAPAVAEKVTIVLLPIVNRAGVSADDIIGEVMTDGLMTDLVKIRGLRVISQSSAKLIKVDEPIAQVGKKLGVDYVLKGSAGKDGEKVLLSMQLWQVVQEKKKWEREYVKAATDTSALQGEVAQEVARQSGVKVTAEDRGRIAEKKVIKPEAYELYLKGRKLAEDQGNEASLKKAIEYLSKVVEMEPEYAEAWAALGMAYSQRGVLTGTTEFVEKSVQALKRALELDPGSSEVQFAMGWASMNASRFTEARTALEAALAANPNHAGAHSIYSYDLALYKRFDEALVEAKEGVRLDPLSMQTNHSLSFQYLWNRKYADGIPAFLKLLELSPDDPLALRNYGWLLAEMGRYDEGIQYLNRAMKLGAWEGEAYVGYVLAKMGDYRKARAIAEKLAREWDPKTNYWGAGDISMIYANMREEKLAMEWLRKAEGLGPLILINIEPEWDPLRSIPEFREMVKRTGFPE